MPQVKRHNLKQCQKGEVMMPQDESAVMSIEELMAYLDIGKTTAYRLIRSGDIKIFKIGRIYKIPRKSVEEYIEQKRH